MPRLRAQMAERIDVSRLQKLRHRLTRFRQVDRIVFIGFRSREVNLRVGNIVVAAKNDVLVLLNDFVAKTSNRIAEF